MRRESKTVINQAVVFCGWVTGAQSIFATALLMIA